MVDNHNNTSHRYDQTMAIEIAGHAIKYHDFMSKTVKKIASEDAI